MVCFIIFLIGVWTISVENNFDNELWYYKHALLLLIFLDIGYYLKSHINVVDNVWVCFLYIISTTLYVLLSSFEFIPIESFWRVPMITLGIENINFFTVIPFLILSTTGTVSILFISKMIAHNGMLEWLGKNSLTIYCTHSFGLVLGAKIFDKLLLTNSIISLFGIAGIYMVGLITGCVAALIVNRKYFKWILGKF